MTKKVVIFLAFLLSICSCDNNDTSYFREDNAGQDTGSGQDGETDNYDGTETETDFDSSSDCDSDGNEVISEPLFNFERGNHLFVVKVVASGADPGDFNFLSSISASNALTDGSPSILAIASEEDLNKSWFSDYLARLKPTHIFAVNLDLTSLQQQLLTSIDGSNSIDYSHKLATTVWKKSPSAVLASQNASDAVLASSFAALFDIPLILTSKSDMERTQLTLNQLGSREVFVFGELDLELEQQTEKIADFEQAISVLGATGTSIKYFAACNPNDLEVADAPKLSLLAAMLAAKRKGLAYTIENASSADSIASELKDLYQAIDYIPEMLALVGSAGAIPLKAVPDTMWTDLFLATDLYYAEVDSDEFSDISIGRIVANDFSEGSLIVSRISTYDKLVSAVWSEKFAETGWGFPEAAPLLKNYGMGETGDLIWADLSQYDLINANVVIHKAHSNEHLLGNAFYLNNDKTLLSPAVIFSKGCGVAGIDVDTTHYRSIVKHLLRQGAIMFVGAPRFATTGGLQAQVATLNHMLNGLPAGEAYKRGINSLTLNYLENGCALSKRERINMMMIGDPAFKLHVPRSPTVSPSAISVDGNLHTLNVPETHFVAQLSQHLTDEWNYQGDLYTASLAGIEAKTAWAGQFDRAEHYFMMIHRAKKGLANVVETFPNLEGLGKDSGLHEDAHQDGTVTTYWRVKVFDFDQQNNQVIKSSPKFTFEVTPKL